MAATLAPTNSSTAHSGPSPPSNASIHSVESTSDDGPLKPSPAANGSIYKTTSHQTDPHQNERLQSSSSQNGSLQPENHQDDSHHSDNSHEHGSVSSQAAGPMKKPGFSSRLSRMFSHRGPSTPGGDTLRSRTQSTATPGAQHGADYFTSKPALVHRDSSAAAAFRSQSNGTIGENKRSGSVTQEQPAISRRFMMLEDGTHEHALKSDKRQEKLSNLFSKMLGKKVEGEPEDHQLSLMSGWVDQMKNEKVATSKAGGPNASNTLVERYGRCQEVVGRGAFGIVRISHKPDEKDPKKEKLYAVKEFRRRPNESPKRYNKRLNSEFCISSSLRHPNVIHTLDLVEDAKGDFCEVMEYCAGGDLYTLVLAAGKLEVGEADCYFKQLMRGVEYMHEMGVSHRDLKPENLLLTNRGALKITDFGNGECFRMAWEQEAHMVAGLCGSAPYISPEEYTDAEFDPRAVDVWACGVIYMAMRTGRHLWRVAVKDDDEFYERYLEGRRDEDGYAPIESLHKARCRNVIYSILDPNPQRRITASQVLKSEWGREIKICKAGEEGF